MRLGLVFEPNSNAYYRALDPARAMAARGHEVVWPEDAGEADLRRLTDCDVVHVYRRAGGSTEEVLTSLRRQGVAIVYDNDDDFTAVPRESPDYRKVGGLRGQRIFALTARTARLASCFTTTNEVLANKYRATGVKRVEVIPNQLASQLPRPRTPHDGVVVGWVAGVDHLGDVARVAIVDALRRLIAKHPNVRVECIGVDLGLSERYRHDEFVPFLELPGRIGGFDVGIAPLADTPGNCARSDIKVKEYAASGVPWLASPVGPYAGLGAGEGGRLVRDDEWFDVLDRLVSRRRERRKLGRQGRRWAANQTIEAVAHRWESVFLDAATRRPERG